MIINIIRYKFVVIKMMVRKSDTMENIYDLGYASHNLNEYQSQNERNSESCDMQSSLDNEEIHLTGEKALPKSIFSTFKTFEGAMPISNIEIDTNIFRIESNRTRIQKYLIRLFSVIVNIQNAIKNFLPNGTCNWEILAYTCTGFIYIIGCAAALIALLILRTNTVFSPNSVGNPLENIIMNLISDPWLDITIKNDVDCPENYVVLKTGIWEGTSEGCFQKNQLSRGICQFGQEIRNDSEAFSYPNFDPIILTNWKSMNFCVKEAHDYYYEVNSCKNGYIKCSPGICYYNLHGCPITNLAITFFNPNITYNLTKETILIYHNYLVLYASKEIGLPAIIELINTENGKECLDNTLKDYGGVPYTLSQNSYNGCKEYGYSPNTSPVDSYLEYNYYIDNSMQWILNFLPNYASYTKKKSTVLIQKSKYQLKPKDKCQNINFSDILNARSALADFDFIFGLNSVVLSTLYFGLAFLTIIMAHIGFPDDIEALILPAFIGALFFVPDCIIFGIITHFKFQIDECIYHINKVAMSDCFYDQTTNKIFEDFMSFYNSLEIQYSLIGFIFYLSSIFFLYSIKLAIKYW